MRQLQKVLYRVGPNVFRNIMAIAVLAGICGCNVPVSVRYSPLASAESLISGPEKPRVYVTRFIDEREKKGNIGRMNNMFGGKVKTLVTTDDFGLILAEATTDALNKAGLNAEQHTDRTSGENIPKSELTGFNYVMGGRIKELEVISQPGWDTVKSNGRVVVDICIHCPTKKSKMEWIGPIEGTSDQRDFMYLNSNSLSGALDQAIQNCMRNMIRHMKASGALSS